jgi:GNAT superfamily N-acetyltransferase
MCNENVCEYLEWDSEFFGKRIARAKHSRLTKQNTSEIFSWCEKNQIDCLYFLADSADPQTSKLAESNNFHFVDIRLTLECLLESSPKLSSSPIEIRVAQEPDIPGLRAIARTSHRASRFYYDGNFSERLCDALYEIWIEKSSRGWARTVLVGIEEGMPMAYITCHISASCPVKGEIGLVGVGDRAQGKGIGQMLVNRALHWFYNERVERVSVVTQGRNIRAQRLYQRSGFLARSVELWYHKWFRYE